MGTVIVVVKNAAPEVLVRVGPLLPGPLLNIIMGARVLRNDREMEILVPLHAVVHVSVVHRVAVTEVWSHWELVVIVAEVSTSLMASISTLLLYALLHVAHLLTSQMLLLGLERPS